MTFTFRAKNGQTSRQSFEERKRYKQRINNPDVDFIDTWYESPNYGLYNEHFEPVILLSDDDQTTSSQFGDYAAPENRAANFVVKAFNMFRDSYNAISENTAIPYPRFIEGLIPKKSYVDFDAAYRDYILETSTILLRRVTEQESKIRNFEDFQTVLKSILVLEVKDRPLSRSGFLLSDKCPINVSGLCVELSNLPYDIDLQKGQMIQSREFLCYADLAKEAGFYIDKNAPWRLVANLESPVMRSLIKEYQQNTTVENTLSRVFRVKTQYDDYEAIRSVMTGIYNQFLSDNPMYTYVSRSKGRDVKVKGLRERIGNYVDAEKWLSLLLEVRMLELGMDMELFEKNKREVLDTHTLYSVRYGNGLKPGLGKIASFCSAHLEKVYNARGQINSYDKTTLKDYR